MLNTIGKPQWGGRRGSKYVELLPFHDITLLSMTYIYILVLIFPNAGGNGSSLILLVLKYA